MTEKCRYRSTERKSRYVPSDCKYCGLEKFCQQLKEYREAQGNNDPITGSSNGTNKTLNPEKDQRIRLNIAEIRMIYKALKFWEDHSGESIQPYTLSRRFWALSNPEEIGHYYPRSRS